MRFRAALIAVLAFFLMAVPCLSASCAVDCDVASLHTATSPPTDCPMHGMSATPRASVIVQGHACAKLCVQQQALAIFCEQPQAVTPAVLLASYVLPPPALAVSDIAAKLSFTRRSGSPPPLSSLRV